VNPHTAFIALGSNLEAPVTQIHQALVKLGKMPKTKLTARSSLYRSVPVGNINQPQFINAVAKLETKLAPRELLRSLLDIELRHGRRREYPNAPRTLDLDLLLYDDLIYHEHGLTIPHPRMHQRAFVLLPLHEIAPDSVVPGIGSVAELLAACSGQDVQRLVED